MKERLFYIDALRAFAMLTVIIGHISLYLLYKGGYEIASENSYYLYFVNSFYMPLFVFLSGLVTNMKSFKVQERLKILIPFLIIGLIYSYMEGSNAIDFFNNKMKNGYWFLLVIVYFFITLWIIRISRINILLGFFAFELIFWGIYNFSQDFSQNVLCITQAIYLWPFFILGVICKKHNIINRLEDYPYLAIIGLITYILCYIYQPPLDGWIMPLAIIVFWVLGFRFVEKKLSSYNSIVKTKTKKLFSLIGQSTIQIYTLHYFFLYFINLTCIGEVIISNDLHWVELFASPVLSILIAVGCVGIANVLYKLKLGGIFGR